MATRAFKVEVHVRLYPEPNTVRHDNFTVYVDADGDGEGNMEYEEKSKLRVVWQLCRLYGTDTIYMPWAAPVGTVARGEWVEMVDVVGDWRLAGMTLAGEYLD